MTDITQNITAYKKIQPNLESEHMSKWVLIYDKKLISIYDTFEKTAEDAVKKFGSGPYLIRQVGVSSQ